MLGLNPVAQDILLDTDVVIDLFERGSPGARWRTHVKDRRPLVSFVTVAELWAGANRRGYGERRMQELRARIDTLIPIPSTDALAEEWGRVVSEAAQLGHPLGVTEQGNAHHAHDAWIAATARLYNLPLLTGNRRHFDSLPRLTLVSGPGAAEES